MHRMTWASMVVLALGACKGGAARPAASAGPLKAETRDVAGFRAVAAAGPVELRVTQGAPQAVKLLAPEALLARIVVDVKEETLYVKIPKDAPDGTKVGLDVTAPKIGRLTVESGATLDAQQLDAERLEVRVHTGAVAKLAGKAAELDVLANKGAVVDARPLAAASVRVGAIGGADVKLGSPEKLAVVASEGAVVHVAKDVPGADVKVMGGAVLKVDGT
jgi:hypothetical protein